MSAEKLLGRWWLGGETWVEIRSNANMLSSAQLALFAKYVALQPPCDPIVVDLDAIHAQHVAARPPTRKLEKRCDCPGFDHARAPVPRG